MKSTWSPLNPNFCYPSAKPYRNDSEGVKDDTPMLRDKGIDELSTISTYPIHLDDIKFNRAFFT